MHHLFSYKEDVYDLPKVNKISPQSQFWHNLKIQTHGVVSSMSATCSTLFRKNEDCVCDCFGPGDSEFNALQSKPEKCDLRCLRQDRFETYVDELQCV